MQKLTGEVKSQTVKQVLIRLGYCNNGSVADWTTREKRTSVDEAWGFIVQRTEQTTRQKPVRAESIIEQLAISKFESRELVFFSPWGPRYKTKNPEVDANSPEMLTIEELREIFGFFSRLEYRSCLLFMPADSYGTDINRLSQDFVQAYFTSLSNMLRIELRGLVDIKITPWSSIKEDNRPYYDELSVEVSRLIDASGNLQLRKAIDTARFFDAENPQNSALKYVKERMIEAEIIDKVYNPIKLSLVRKEKDELDGNLKRIYIVKNRAPWMSNTESGACLRNEGV